MKVTIQAQDQLRLNNLQSDKVVHVKIIERKGLTAVIDVNGYKTEANIEADVPDHFLAYIEKSHDQDKTRISLRILSSLKNNPEFAMHNKEKGIETIRLFLLENNLSLTENTFSAALKLYSAGLKLDYQRVKLLQTTLSRFGEQAAEVLLRFMKGTAVLDDTFIEFLLHSKLFFNEMLKDQKIPLAQYHNPEAHQQEQPVELKLISELFSKFTPDGGYYHCELIENGAENQVIQIRKEKRQDTEHYYIDASGGSITTFLIMADVTINAVTTTVYLEPAFYQLNSDELDKGKDELEKLIQTKLPGRMFSMRFVPATQPEMFWLGEDTPVQDNGNRINLDISV